MCLTGKEVSVQVLCEALRPRMCQQFSTQIFPAASKPAAAASASELPRGNGCRHLETFTLFYFAVGLPLPK